ncbi:hypothetical protein ADUPG1_012889, partial [Aduncisulcus paluster]
FDVDNEEECCALLIKYLKLLISLVKLNMNVAFYFSHSQRGILALGDVIRLLTKRMHVLLGNANPQVEERFKMGWIQEWGGVLGKAHQKGKMKFFSHHFTANNLNSMRYVTDAIFMTISLVSNISTVFSHELRISYHKMELIEEECRKADGREPNAISETKSFMLDDLIILGASAYLQKMYVVANPYIIDWLFFVSNAHVFKEAYPDLVISMHRTFSAILSLLTNFSFAHVLRYSIFKHTHTYILNKLFLDNLHTPCPIKDRNIMWNNQLISSWRVFPCLCNLVSCCGYYFPSYHSDEIVQSSSSTDDHQSRYSVSITGSTGIQSLWLDRWEDRCLEIKNMMLLYKNASLIKAWWTLLDELPNSLRTSACLSWAQLVLNLSNPSTRVSRRFMDFEMEGMMRRMKEREVSRGWSSELDSVCSQTENRVKEEKLSVNLHHLRVEEATKGDDRDFECSWTGKGVMFIDLESMTITIAIVVVQFVRNILLVENVSIVCNDATITIKGVWDNLIS